MFKILKNVIAKKCLFSTIVLPFIHRSILWIMTSDGIYYPYILSYPTSTEPKSIHCKPLNCKSKYVLLFWFREMHRHGIFFTFAFSCDVADMHAWGLNPAAKFGLYIFRTWAIVLLFGHGPCSLLDSSWLPGLNWVSSLRWTEHNKYAENIGLLGPVSIVHIQVLTNFPQTSGMLHEMFLESELGCNGRLAVWPVL